MPGHHSSSHPPGTGHKRRRRIRDHSEVSCCLKYVIFGFNVIFWLLGLGVLAIGIWAWTEKDTFNNLSKLTESFVICFERIIIFGNHTTFLLNYRYEMINCLLMIYHLIRKIDSYGVSIVRTMINFCQDILQIFYLDYPP